VGLAHAPAGRDLPAFRIYQPNAPVTGDVFQQGEPLIVQNQPWDLSFVITTGGDPIERGACCYEEGGLILCTITTPEDCDLIYGGTWQGVNTDCSDLDGNGVADICENAVEVGACCYLDDLGNIQCVVTTDVNCQQFFSGVWKGPAPTAPTPTATVSRTSANSRSSAAPAATKRAA
jgi:hypothetical protein